MDGGWKKIPKMCVQPLWMIPCSAPLWQTQRQSRRASYPCGPLDWSPVSSGCPSMCLQIMVQGGCTFTFVTSQIWVALPLATFRARPCSMRPMTRATQNILFKTLWFPENITFLILLFKFLFGVNKNRTGDRRGYIQTYKMSALMV